jgi:predicted ester cyclase
VTLLSLAGSVPRLASDEGAALLSCSVPRMTTEANVAAVRDFIERAWNAGDESVFEEHLAPDIGHPGGREGFKKMVLGFRAAFPDFELEPHEMFGLDDKVVTRFTMRGTHKGEFLGVAPTGRRVAFDGIAIGVMRDGQRVGGWAQLDRLGLLTQLGAVEPSN